MKFSSLRGNMQNCCANYQGNYDKNDRGCAACSESRGIEDDIGQDRGQDLPQMEEESQSHLSICQYYSHPGQGLDITTTEDSTFKQGRG